MSAAREQTHPVPSGHAGRELWAGCPVSDQSEGLKGAFDSFSLSQLQGVSAWSLHLKAEAQLFVWWGLPFDCHGWQGQPLVEWRQSSCGARPLGQGFHAVLVAEPAAVLSWPLTLLAKAVHYASMGVMEPFGSMAWMDLFCYCPLWNQEPLGSASGQVPGSQSDLKCQGWKLQAQSAPECGICCKLQCLEVLGHYCTLTTNYCSLAQVM